VAEQIKVKAKMPANRPVKITVTPMKRRAQLTDRLAQARCP
jgi:hypothetical protein